MEVEKLSTKKVDIKSRKYWQDAIGYGEWLLEAAKSPKSRARLSAAIDWFKQRLEAGAGYPGLPVSETEQHTFTSLPARRASFL